jgi:Calpain family cysteine protease
MLLGEINNRWLFSTIGTLADDFTLIKKIFLTSEYNAEGLYQLLFCKNGEWQVVTVDDYLPCFPKAEHIFSHTSDVNELWLTLLEKSYAKLHGGYSQILKGIPFDALMDLTGFPTLSMTLRDESVYNLIENGYLWLILKAYLD